MYASTEEILKTAAEKMHLLRSKPKRVLMESGDIICINKNGSIDRGEFNTDRMFSYSYISPFTWCRPSASYVKELKAVAKYYGYDGTVIDNMLEDGFTTDEVEELLYCGGM